MESQILFVLRMRQACKLFNPHKNVDDAAMLEICESFILTPTSYGLQPVNMTIVKNIDAKMQLQEIAFNQQQVGSASHVIILSVEKNIDADFILSHEELINDQIKNSNCSKEKVVERLLYHLDPEKLDINSWADNQAYIALGNLINTLAMLGIDACPMEGFNKSWVDSYLGLNKQNLRSVLMLPIGFKSTKEPNRPKLRKKISEVIQFYPKHNK